MGGAGLYSNGRGGGGAATVLFHAVMTNKAIAKEETVVIKNDLRKLRLFLFVMVLLGLFFFGVLVLLTVLYGILLYLRVVRCSQL